MDVVHCVWESAAEVALISRTLPHLVVAGEISPSKSPPELLGRLVRSRTNPSVEEWDGTRPGEMQTRPRADEVSFRKLESPSGLQIANFRYASSMFAFSADANVHLLLCRRKAKEPSLQSAPHTHHRHSPNINSDERPRADGKESNLSNRDPKKFDRQCIDNRRVVGND